MVKVRVVVKAKPKDPPPAPRDRRSVIQQIIESVCPRALEQVRRKARKDGITFKRFMGQPGMLSFGLVHHWYQVTEKPRPVQMFCSICKRRITYTEEEEAYTHPLTGKLMMRPVTVLEQDTDPTASKVPADYVMWKLGLMSNVFRVVSGEKVPWTPPAVSPEIQSETKAIIAGKNGEEGEEKKRVVIVKRRA